MKLIKIPKEHIEFQDNVIVVEKWKKQNIFKFICVLVLFLSVAGFLLTAAVAVGTLGGEAIRSYFGVEDGLQR